MNSEALSETHIAKSIEGLDAALAALMKTPPGLKILSDQPTLNGFLTALAADPCIIATAPLKEVAVCIPLPIASKWTGAGDDMEKLTTGLRAPIAVFFTSLQGKPIDEKALGFQTLTGDDEIRKALGALAEADGFHFSSNGGRAWAVKTPAIDAAPAAKLPPSDLTSLYDVSVEISVELGRTRLPIRDILGFQNGTLVPLGKAPGESVEVFVNSKLMAKGEVVVQDDNFAVRITKLIEREKK